MLTRMEKYSEYRQEIADNSKIHFNVASDLILIDKYRKSISKINSHILSDDDHEKKIEINSMVQNNVYLQSVPQELTDAFSLINELKLSMVSSDINIFFEQIKNASILENNGSEIKDEWLYQGNDELKAMNDIVDLYDLKNQKKSETKLREFYDSSFNNVVSEKQILTLKPIKTKPKTTFYLYLSSAIIVVILVLVFVMIILIGSIIY